MRSEPSGSERFAFYQAHDDRRYGLDSDKGDEPAVRRLIDAHRPRIVLELGCGIEGFCHVSPEWVGCDISWYALSKNPGANTVCCDWSRALPFRTGSIPFAVSVFALEHIPRPEFALTELDRILAPGGIVYLKPAFNVPAWRASGLEYRRPRDLPMLDKVRRAFLPLWRTMAWRYAFGIGWGRLFDEVRWTSARARRGTALSLRWRRLEPYAGGFIGPDSDAVCAVDKSAIALWFLSRGYRVIEGDLGTLKGRILADHSALTLQKKMA